MILRPSCLPLLLRRISCVSLSFLLFLDWALDYSDFLAGRSGCLKLVKEGSLQYFCINFVQSILVLSVQILPILLMPFYLYFRFDFVHLCSVWEGG